MTSNLGSDLILEADSKEKESSVKEEISELLKKTFRPEFLNRIDEIVMFNKLDFTNIKGIVSKELKRVSDRLSDRRMSINFEDSALDFISKQGYDPSFGARPVKRAIQNYVENPLSLALLEGKFTEGSTIKVSSDGNKLNFS